MLSKPVLLLGHGPGAGTVYTSEPHVVAVLSGAAVKRGVPSDGSRTTLVVHITHPISGLDTTAGLVSHDLEDAAGFGKVRLKRPVTEPRLTVMGGRPVAACGVCRPLAIGP